MSTFFRHARFPFLLPWLCCEGAPIAFFAVVGPEGLDEDLGLGLVTDVGCGAGFMAAGMMGTADGTKKFARIDAHPVQPFLSSCG